MPTTALGTTTWVVADGYIPTESTGPEPAMTSHDSICILNAGNEPSHVEITVFYSDREPVGPYRLTVPARRAYHQRINDLTDPEPISPGTDYCLVIHSDQRIVVQHTRLDSRQAENALMSTIAYPAAV